MNDTFKSFSIRPSSHILRRVVVRRESRCPRLGHSDGERKTNAHAGLFRAQKSENRSVDRGKALVQMRRTAPCEALVVIAAYARNAADTARFLGCAGCQPSRS